MNAAVLTEPGGLKLAQPAQRAVVLATIASLHALIVYLLASGSPANYSSLDAYVTEAEVIPVDLRIPKPPSFPPVILEASSLIDLPPLQITIDVAAEQVAATQAIDTRDLGDSQLPVAAAAPPPAFNTASFSR